MIEVNGRGDVHRPAAGGHPRPFAARTLISQACRGEEPVHVCGRQVGIGGSGGRDWSVLLSAK
ncbi:hypothetical protein ACFRMN_13880 [Streptomyces sp. NPDC056835]|uniref:hypothetical protein n=1 Tax=Streptomyces sp. NPDC056835 TaxID=3345956 RepID=UPI003675F178